MSDHDLDIALDQDTEDRYIVIDMETSIKNRGEESIGSFKASPYHPDNKVVMCGWKVDDGSTLTSLSIPILPSAWNIGLMVGHNIGFDLLYALKSEPSWAEWLKTGHIWDTMLVEYLITGQQEKFASLDKCSKKYGGTLKDERIKEYWENGVDTEDIPKDELDEYLVQDVENTELVFTKQLEIANHMNLFPLIRTQMEARIATVEMEWNGMHVDREVLHNQHGLFAAVADLLKLEMLRDMRTNCGHFDNPTSSQQIAIFIFGGELKYKYTKDVVDEDGKLVAYKTGKRKGQIKTKIVEDKVTVPGMLTGATYSTLGKNGWSVSEAVLNNILSRVPRTSRIGLFVDKLLKSRTLEKDINTYYAGYNKLLWHDDKLHPSYNHCSTNTGRLSCSNPNLQQASGE